jgi:predicted phage terminase large subunit-like protein
MTISTPESRTWKSELLRLRRERLRRQARANFYAYTIAQSPAEYSWNWHHLLFADELARLWTGETPFLIIEAPPGHGKSEECSRLFPSWWFGKDPDAKIVATSHTHDLAKEMTRDVRGIMETSSYKATFPGVRIGSRSRTRTRLRDDLFDIEGRRGLYKAVGVGGGLTGRRFNLGLIDDPVKDRESANSKADREKRWRWWNSVFRTRRHKLARIGIVGTRWHGEDLIGRIRKRAIENPKAPQPRVVTLRALARDEKIIGDPRQPGDALWPWFRTREELETERESDPMEFAALYDQDPRAEGAVEWGPELFTDDLWFDDWPTGGINLRIMALDPSKGTDAKHGDDSAFVMLARTGDGMLWVDADLANNRGTTQIVHDAFDLAREFERQTRGRLEGFACEANQFQELLADQIIAYSRIQGGYTLPVYKITNVVNKNLRIRRLTPELTSRNVRFRRTRGTRRMVEQMKSFPVGDHDDGPDAFEMARRLGQTLWAGKVLGR